MVRIRRRRTLHLSSIILIGTITGFVGILLFFFITSWLEEHTATMPRPFANMNCLQLTLYKYGDEYQTLNEQENADFELELAKCVEP